jgi:hypothetical protein
VVIPAVITAVASASTSAGNTVRTIYAGTLAPLGTQPTSTTLNPP